MARKSRQDPRIREFILRNLSEHPADIVAVTMRKFGYSRPAVNRYMRKLGDEGFIAAKGNTYGRRYNLRPVAETKFELEITHLWAEDDIWREKILPLMANVPENVRNICQYGFTEMLNNVLDHARSRKAMIYYCRTYSDILIYVVDIGIGIFQKIQQDFKLDDPRTALLELSKGKLTSDSKNHSGEGIYFTSRAFDSFRIRSGNLYYSRAKREGDDWLVEVNDRKVSRTGTLVEMKIKTDANWSMRDVFDKYQGDNLRFRKTHVPIKLAQYPGEQLVSRSQAKRVLSRFDKFSEVFLDFKDVQGIGQAFADEIFRVYRKANPKVEISVANACEDVLKMIRFVSPEPVKTWSSG